MGRILVVPHVPTFVEDVMEVLGDLRDADITVIDYPDARVWEEAAMVVVDGRAEELMKRMPARRDTYLVTVGLLGLNAIKTRERLAWRYEHVTVLELPHHAELLREFAEQARDAGPRTALRVGVVGGHGGAGTTTLAVSLAGAAALSGRPTLLLDGDRLSAGIAKRIKEGYTRQRPDRLKVLDRAELEFSGASLATAMDEVAADVVIIDFGRDLDPMRLAAARRCDVVLVVADVTRNLAATRLMLEQLRIEQVGFVVVPRTCGDHWAQLLAGDFTAPLADELPPRPARGLDHEGAVDLRDARGDLIAYASGLLDLMPELAAEAAV
ncbi:hypothetical protein Ait01nite_020450 [Actinoplanes italicus]|uniref:Uncharacterized protein n=1 Tax=Actinoplanes italicus TaxID=113567 RepID=A0A2T0KP95_9ACTN|nr:hypothetical protein [Actinoplanes italicus]PRX25556.1 hypothetical protein CLV67_101273 [Actinoplanes italicus]GIE29000.1 hypothetical protein Ait01nite_020450 [Actinoplanes italicus]